MTITTASYDGHPFGPDVVSEIFNVGLSAAPLFNAFTQKTTARTSLSMPVGDPSGFDWTAELADIPVVSPGDDTKVVVPLKLAGQILLSNESVSDSELNLTDEVGRLIAESMAPKMDTDLCYGDVGGPGGYFAGLTEVEKTTLRSAVIDGAAAIMTGGGTPTHVALSPALWAAEVERRETTQTATVALFDDLGLNLTVFVANTLAATDALVFDAAGCFAVTRNDLSIEVSDTAGTAWTKDGVSLRVKGRVGVLIPAPAKSIRKLAVDPTP